MGQNPLAPSALAPLMVASVGRSAAPQLRNAYDAVALFSHACMLAVEFRLVGLGEDHQIEAQSGSEEPSLRGVVALPFEWNATPSPTYAFRYAHPQSSMEYVVKVNRMGSKAVVLAMGLGDDRTASFDIAVRDYLSESALPLSFASRPPSPSAGSREHDGAGAGVRAAEGGDGGGGGDASTASTSDDGARGDDASKRQQPSREKQIQDVFISPHRLADLATLFKVNIIQRIMPGLYKAGYEEERSTASQSSAGGHGPSSSSASEQQQQQQRRRQEPDGRAGEDPLRAIQPPHPFRGGEDDDFSNPLALPPHHRRPRQPVGDFPPPGFEDEYELTRPERRGGGMMGGIGPFGGGGGVGIGHDDLYPAGLGPHDPLRPSWLPPGRRGPGGAGGAGSGGMHPSLGDPLFFGGAQPPQEYDPSRPPGARYDPIGPGDGPAAGRHGGGSSGGVGGVGGDMGFGPGGGRGGGGGGVGGRGGSRSGGPPNPFGGFGGGAFI